MFWQCCFVTEMKKPVSKQALEAERLGGCSERETKITLCARQVFHSRRPRWMGVLWRQAGREAGREPRELSQCPALLDVCPCSERWRWLRRRCQGLAQCSASAAAAQSGVFTQRENKLVLKAQKSVRVIILRAIPVLALNFYNFPNIFLVCVSKTKQTL